MATGPVDCHCHLSAPCFQPDVAAVVREARQAAVAALVTVTEQAGEFRSVLELSDRFPGFVLPCLGVHPVQEVSPEEQRSVTLKDLDAALPLIELYKDKLVAVGEVGLDFTPRFAGTDEQKEGQRQVLIKQVELARKLDLPLNVHSRSAGRPTINLLKEQGASKVLLHAFDGKPSVAMEGVKAGYFFSIPPSIIRSDQKQKLVKVLPLESICLETDSPALGPEKQVRNEPKNIYIAAEYIAKIKGIPVEEVIEVTTQNALKVFPKLRNFLQEENSVTYYRLTADYKGKTRWQHNRSTRCTFLHLLCAPRHLRVLISNIIYRRAPCSLITAHISKLRTFL